MKKLVVFTGAGISAESGLKTFRGDDGLWEGYRVQDVATPEAWKRDPAMVLEFYNIRRKQCLAAQPNAAHKAFVELESDYDVHVITQNVDDLHERAGSKKVLHLHGEIRKAQSSLSPKYVYGMSSDEIVIGDMCELGSQLRPHIVWFGEAVPMMDRAEDIVSDADILVVVGTSLQVYPAANLLNVVSHKCVVYLIDPQAEQMKLPSHIKAIASSATAGVGILRKMLTK